MEQQRGPVPEERTILTVPSCDQMGLPRLTMLIRTMSGTDPPSVTRGGKGSEAVEKLIENVVWWCSARR